MEKLRSFVLYNNTFVIILGALFLGVGGVFAASPDTIFSSTQSLLSVDNSYILSVDLSVYTPQIQITNVTEDDTYYYVQYTFNTIDLSGGAWQNVAENKQLRVAKTDLGSGDLGTYVTGQLAQVLSNEMDRLRKTQAIEREKGKSEEVVATTYSGLIGKLLTPKDQVVPAPEAASAELAIKPPETPTAPPPGAPSDQGFTSGSSTSSSSSSASSSGGDTTPPSVTVLGNNPAEVALGTSYVDLGAAVTDNVNTNLGVHYKVDGIAVSQVTIDTSVVGTHTVTYSATDQAGNTGSAQREVDVYDPNATSTPTSSSSTSTTTSSGTTSTSSGTTSATTSGTTSTASSTTTSTTSTSSTTTSSGTTSTSSGTTSTTTTSGTTSTASTTTSSTGSTSTSTTTSP